MLFVFSMRNGCVLQVRAVVYNASMDNQQTYLLNGLLTRHFGLGRIVRFRQVERGRQASTFELFTAQENEYLVYLYPAAYTVEQLNFVANTVNRLDLHRFSVVPFVKAKVGAFAAEGPQNSHMLVSIAPAGSVLAPASYSDHDVSQIGLRLAWMHRLLKEQLPDLPQQASLAERVREACGAVPPDAARPPIALNQLSPLLALLSLPTAQGWVHGDIQGSALLVDNDHQLRTVTDWGLLHAGSPLEDLVDAFLSLCTNADGELLPVRGRALLEAYHSLLPIQRIPWMPVVASWCAQRILDSCENRRPLPRGFSRLLEEPERLATALASCL